MYGGRKIYCGACERGSPQSLTDSVVWAACKKHKKKDESRDHERWHPPGRYPLCTSSPPSECGPFAVGVQSKTMGLHTTTRKKHTGYLIVRYHDRIFHVSLEGQCEQGEGG